MGNSLSNQVFKAIKHNDLPKLQKCIEKGVNLNKENKLGITPIEYAITLGNYHIIRELVINGVELNRKFGHSKMTPLHFAVHFKNFDVIVLLTNNGSKVNITDANGETPIDLARMYELNDIVEYLLMFE